MQKKYSIFLLLPQSILQNNFCVIWRGFCSEFVFVRGRLSRFGNNAWWNPPKTVDYVRYLLHDLKKQTNTHVVVVFSTWSFFFGLLLLHQTRPMWLYYAGVTGNFTKSHRTPLGGECGKIKWENKYYLHFRWLIPLSLAWRTQPGSWP